MYRSVSACPHNGCYSFENQDQVVADLVSPLLRLDKASSNASRQSPFLGDLDFDLALDPVRSLIHSQLVQVNLKYLQEPSRGAGGENYTPTSPGLGSQGSGVKFGIYHGQAAGPEGDGIVSRPVRIKSSRSHRFPKPYCIPGRLYQAEVNGKSDGSEEEEGSV